MPFDEMTQGYIDGFEDDRADFPESLSNRGFAYRHGWLNGRDDRTGKPRLAAQTLREMAEIAEAKDAEYQPNFEA
jgi:hypothetical protein